MQHVPVMVEEVMKYLNVKEGGTYIDATAGGGGHLQKIVEKVGKGGTVIAVDQNKSAVGYLKKEFPSLFPEQGRRDNEKESTKPFDFRSFRSGGNVTVVRGNFKFIEKIAEKVIGLISPIGSIDGVLFDLGFSSDEIQENGRGFSFEDDESLDMRYSEGEHGEFLCECHTESVEVRQDVKEMVPFGSAQGKLAHYDNYDFSAKEVVNSFGEKELADIFWRYGDERRSRFFAKKIVDYRQKKPIESAMELAYVVGNARPTFESFQTLVRHAHSDAPDGGSESRPKRRLARPQDPAPSRADSPETSVVLNQHFQNGQKVRGRAFSPPPRLQRISSPGGLHPATKVFMALRIFVNHEFENIEKGLEGALNVLKPEGRCVIISFHSGEDRIVKKFITQRIASADAKALADRQGDILNLTKHVVKPSREEVLANRLSRSAVMRAFEKN